MIFEFDIIILILLVIVSILAINVKDLIGATMLTGIYSFLICLLWAQMGAVDVAFTEAAVGAGISTILFVATVYRTQRRSSD
ncbi:MAG: DUF4040 domain-containing protein [Lentisphaeria bacterium]|nr:DUF4040 domain-containing protein [Lentisphaeria bacterium]